MVKIYQKPHLRPENRPRFLVSNISKNNVSLADLSLTIKAYATVDLLDPKHYHFTLEQLEKSADSGSIYKKSNRIKVRQVPLEQIIKPGLQQVKIPNLPERQLRSLIEIEKQKYDELEITDEQFAEEAAGIVNLNRPVLSSDK